MAKKKKKSKPKKSFKDLPIGTKKTIKTKKGRKITIERVRAYGKNKNLISKIIKNEKA